MMWWIFGAIGYFFMILVFFFLCSYNDVEEEEDYFGPNIAMSIFWPVFGVLFLVAMFFERLKDAAVHVYYQRKKNGK